MQNTMAETIPQFYKRIQRCAPKLDATYSKGKEYFNIFSRRCNFGTVQFSYRDFYKVTLIMGIGKLYYADKWILVDRPALLFSNPLHLIIGKADAAGVQVGRFRRPEAGVIKGQGKYGLAVALLLHGGQVVHRQAYSAGGGGLYAHLHDGRVKRQGADFNAVQCDMRTPCRPKLHRAVDARAGIPA